ncbi:hypothetical protein N9X61_03345 [Sulfurimonas sp.]|nr:hypothetical protein [Sulfurimonas sp.]
MQNLYEKMGLFYLGKENNDSLALYKSKHLTTHAMMIGMTGSGKTGLGIGLIEEAAIDNIPSIVIDPKGDMGNLCLAFPSLHAKDYEPWLDSSDALSKDISVAELAKEKANMWKDGLGSSFQDSARVKKFADVEKTIYTPGSSAGVSVNILGSFETPTKEVLEDTDTLASLINATVSSLLALVSIDADSINSKEHLLLSNILHHFYMRETSLSLEDIIGYIALPPFEKIGLFSLKTFYPQKERMKLAMTLNGVISSISFASWIQGEALNIQNMLYGKNGKAKIAIFSIAHLSDNERMFFVTILLNAYINWMRKQRGSSTLKNILYMDEIFGFFPPSANPPSKKPMLLLLKQARAFGTGIVLSTQNPVDIDYKGLSNIGTWFVGKLQTKQDIQKVLEPLSAKSKLSKDEIAHKIATLKGRHFFMKNVHLDETIEFSTRWVLSYLKGPMTKDDIKLLMSKKKNTLQEKVEQVQTKQHKIAKNKPILSEDIKEYFLDTNINATTPFYPYLYASVEVRFYNQKRSIDKVEKVTLKLELDPSQNTIHWENSLEDICEGLTSKVNTNLEFTQLPNIILESRSLKEFEKSLLNYLYHGKKIELFLCKSLKLESKLNQTKQEFLIEVEDTLKDLKAEKQDKLEEKFKVRIDRLENKLQRLEIKLQKEESDVSSKTTDTILDIGLAVIGAFFGRKALSTTNIRRGASAFKKGKSVLKEKADVQNVESLIKDVEIDIEELNRELQNEILQIEDSLQIENYEITSFFIKPRRSDVIIKDLALLWER